MSDYKDKADKLGVPVIPPLPETAPVRDPNPVAAVCGQCGLEIMHIMSYVCSNPRCPTGLGGLRM